MTIQLRPVSFLLLLIPGFLFAISIRAVAQTPVKTPYDKDRLLRVLELKALPTQEIVEAIRQRGVDFQMTPAVESEFRAAGAFAELIEAIRNKLTRRFFGARQLNLRAPKRFHYSPNPTKTGSGISSTPNSSNTRF